MQTRAKDWWANREHGERGGVHVGQTLGVGSCWRFVYWCILSLDDNCIDLVDIDFYTSCICFQTRGTPHLYSFAIIQGFHNILSMNTHTNTFSTYRPKSRIAKVHVSRSCESGVLEFPMRPGSQSFMHNPYMNPDTKPNAETEVLHYPLKHPIFPLRLLKGVVALPS